MGPFPLTTALYPCTIRETFVITYLQKHTKTGCSIYNRVNKTFTLNCIGYHFFNIKKYCLSFIYTNVGIYKCRSVAVVKISSHKIVFETRSIPGRTYQSCTKDYDIDRKFWCSTKVGQNHIHISKGGHWGFCNESCRLNSINTLNL